MIGLIPGIIIMFFILNQKGVSCSGYLPNSRVITETLSKEWTYARPVDSVMETHHISKKFLRDTIFSDGGIDFGKSNPQRKPYPIYKLYYPTPDNAQYEVDFEKRKDTAYFYQLKVLRK